MARRVIANNLLLDQASQLVASGKEVQIPTKGSSMFPFIVGGKDTLVLIEPSNLAIGDIVLAKINDTRYVVHRIMEINAKQITLMGDGNIVGRETCSTSQVTAKVKSIISNGKEIDCAAPRQKKRAKLWRTLLPIRRYILGIWRRTPFWPFRTI